MEKVTAARPEARVAAVKNGILHMARVVEAVAVVHSVARPEAMAETVACTVVVVEAPDTGMVVVQRAREDRELSSSPIHRGLRN